MIWVYLKGFMEFFFRKVREMFRGKRPGVRRTFTDKEMFILKESRLQVFSQWEELIGIFYTKLFSLDPDVKALFSSMDMQTQGPKIKKALFMMTEGFRRGSRGRAFILALGARHVGYKVEDHHYPILEEALMYTLKRGLEDKFSKEVEEVWKKAYRIAADNLMEASRLERERLSEKED